MEPAFKTGNIIDYKKNIELKQRVLEIDYKRAGIIFKKLYFYIKNDTFINSEIIIDNPEVDVNSLINELTNNRFNLCGQIKEIKNKFVKLDYFDINSIRVDITLKLFYSEENINFTIKLKSAKKELFEKMNRFIKTHKTYITNLYVIMHNNNDKLEPIFLNTLDTKIYVNNVDITDNDSPLIITKVIDVLYRSEKKKENESNNREIGRNSVSTMRINNYRNLLDLTKNNEAEFINIIDSIDINDSLSKIDIRFKDLSRILVKDVKFSIYGMTNALNINDNVELISVCSVIRNIKRDEKIMTIDLLSVKDSNSIKMLIYNQNKFEYLKENMIILIQKVCWKINKNFDIILENPDDRTIQIVGMITSHESNRLKRFRIDRNKDLDCIIDLTQPRLIRNIQKYLVTIKKIYKIQAIYESGSEGVLGYPGLRLIAKCMVDDGSYEANIFFYDQIVVNLLRISKEILIEIVDMSRNCGNLVIYEKFNQWKILPKDCFESIFIKQFYVYSVPYSNLAKKHFFDNNYNKYFENLGGNNNLKNRVMNKTFINGDLYFQKTIINESVIQPMPFLKALNIEYID